MRVTRVSIFGIMAIFFCCGGFSLINPENLVTEKPTRKVISGVYRFVSQKVIRNDINNYNTAKIKLFDDGTCELTKFPVFTENDEGYQLEKIFTGECKWNIDTIYDGNSIYGVCFEAMDFNPSAQCATLVKKEASYILVFIFDEELGSVLSFAKDN